MASSERADQILAQMADSNPELIEGLIGAQIQNIENSGLDPKLHALVRIGALVAVGAPSASFAWQVSLARESGATADEITGSCSFASSGASSGGATIHPTRHPVMAYVFETL
jgi:alkylhydroperoxidase/carboxymuconolactone decarboxylase family protein YurZ